MKGLRMAVAVSAVAVITAIGCNSAKTEAPAPASQAQSAAPMTAQALSGKVVETMNAAGYTYVCLENNGKKTWVAVPESKVKVGQELACQPGSVMQNFKSKTLNRTFETIIFSPGVI